MGEKRQTEHTQANAVTVEPKSSSQRSQQKVRHDIEMICAWVSFAALVVCNVLAQTGVMRRMVKPQHSEAFTWFVPARYTDLIWAVIFVFAAVWLVRLGNDKHRARNPARSRPVSSESCSLPPAYCKSRGCSASMP